MNKKILKTVINYILDLVFPINCIVCGTKPDGKQYVCSACLENIEPNPTIFQIKNSYIDQVLIPYQYKDPIINKIVKTYKFNFVRDLSQTISELIIKYLEKIKHKINFNDLILIPIPLTKRRENWRGFNQAQLIASGIKPFFEKNNYQYAISYNLKRSVHRKPQTDTNKEKRQENIKDVFVYESDESIKGKRILLIDDVYTTGSTMNEAAKVLKRTGAKEVIGLVFAQG